MKSYRIKFMALILAVGMLSTSVMAYANTETEDVDAYKDYIAMELNAELFDSMGVENGVFPDEYAGAYIDDSGNYHVCITEADAQPAFEAVLNEDMTSAIASEATDGASLGKRAIKEINSVEVQYDIKQFSYEYLKSIQNILTEHMEELEIHRIGIKQRDNVVDIYMDSGMEEKIEDCLRQNIENFDIAAVRVHIDDSEMNYMATKTVTPYSGNEIKCTLKDTVYTSTIGFHAVDFWGEAGIVTAGHGAPKGSSAKYNGYSLGTTESSSLSGKLDCAFIPFTDTSSVTWKTSASVNEVDTTIYNGLSVIATESRIVEGARTEKYGIINGKTYGTIENTSASVSVKGDDNVVTKFTDFVTINDGSDKGDSGGTVGLRAKTAKAKLYLLGITSSGNSSTTNVCKASNICDAYGLDAVTQ